MKRASGDECTDQQFAAWCQPAFVCDCRKLESRLDKQHAADTDMLHKVHNGSQLHWAFTCAL